VVPQLGWRTAVALSRILAGQLLRGQTNFLKMLFKFSKVYNAGRFYGDHSKPVSYPMLRPSDYPSRPTINQLMIHARAGRDDCHLGPEAAVCP
jgi:magnesium-protoporphyrin IX monomethyl ester (oxidative) cyclase